MLFKPGRKMAQSAVEVTENCSKAAMLLSHGAQDGEQESEEAQRRG
jgi:hypothetical protein